MTAFLTKLLGKKLILDLQDLYSFGKGLNAFVRGLAFVIERLYKLLSDAVVLFSSNEYTYFSKLFRHSNKLFLIPNSIEFLQNEDYNQLPKKFETLIDGKRIVLFIGDLSTPVNIPAVDYIVRILSQIFRERNDIIFIIAGRGHELWVRKPISFYNSNVLFTGLLLGNTLAAIIKRASVCIAPHSYNTGLKTKILHYVLYKKPVVVTKESTLGLPIKFMPSVVVCDLVSFPIVLGHVLEYAEKYNDLTEETLRFVLSEFSLSRFKASYESLLQHLYMNH
jgi:glycosyltransferase involved in cell wall biosynthesis